MRKTLIIESKNELEKEVSTVDHSMIKKLYKKANFFIPNLSISFEKTINFHNSLIKNKLEYITKELPDLQYKINNLEKSLKEFIEKEALLTEELRKKGVLENLENIIKKLTENYEKKGGLEERKEQLETCFKNIQEIENSLSKINKDIESKDESLQNNIASFNKYFSDISKELYNESYILSSDKNENTNSLELNISNIESNPGTGKKQGQIAAFDFAYISFADELKIPCLHFIMHDQLETIHDNQFSTLIKIANSMNGQYIVPILKDKIQNDVPIKDYVILSLSQNDKLFKF